MRYMVIGVDRGPCDDAAAAQGFFVIGPDATIHSTR